MNMNLLGKQRLISFMKKHKKQIEENHKNMKNI